MKAEADREEDRIFCLLTYRMLAIVPCWKHLILLIIKPSSISPGRNLDGDHLGTAGAPGRVKITTRRAWSKSSGSHCGAIIMVDSAGFSPKSI